MIIKHRNKLPELLNFLKLNNIGVEIGVACGAYSSIILDKSNLKLLYSIDNWDDDKIKIKAENQLIRFGNRNKILHITSKDASKLFKNNELDFAYIDANHIYQEVKEDLELWYPKVKIGGIFAGHDYVEIENKYGKFGVIQAVNEMIKKYNQDLIITKERYQSWYFIKK